jgi:hypothetical protein
MLGVKRAASEQITLPVKKAARETSTAQDQTTTGNKNTANTTVESEQVPVTNTTSSSEQAPGSNNGVPIMFSSTLAASGTNNYESIRSLHVGNLYNFRRATLRGAQFSADLFAQIIINHCSNAAIIGYNTLTIHFSDMYPIGRIKPSSEIYMPMPRYLSACANRNEVIPPIDEPISTSYYEHYRMCLVNKLKSVGIYATFITVNNTLNGLKFIW